MSARGYCVNRPSVAAGPPPGLVHYLGRIGFGVHDHSKPADHHFLPALVAPPHFHLRIRIERVVGRIVEMRRAFHARALGQHDGLGFVVSDLPVEAEMRYLERRLRFAASDNPGEYPYLCRADACAAANRSAHGSVELGHRVSPRSWHRPAESRNRAPRPPERQLAILRRFFRQHEAHLGLIGRRLAIRGVMHLEARCRIRRESAWRLCGPDRNSSAAGCRAHIPTAIRC